MKSLLFILLTSLTSGFSATNPNIGFIARPLAFYSTILNNPFKQPNRRVLFVPGGPSNLVGPLMEKGYEQRNVVLADILYGRSIEELEREFNRSFLFQDGKVDWNEVEKLYGRKFSEDDRNKINETFRQFNNPDEFSRMRQKLKDQFFEEYLTKYPNNFVQADITELNFPADNENFNVEDGDKFDDIICTNLLHVYKSFLSEQFHEKAYSSMLSKLKVGGRLLVFPIDCEDLDFVNNFLRPLIDEMPEGFELNLIDTGDSDRNQMLKIIEERPATQYLDIRRMH